MKKLNFAILALSLVIAVACSKKTTSPPVITVAPPPVPQVTAKVNGTTASCNTCYSGSSSGGLMQANFALNGTDVIRFFCSSVPAPGTYTLSKSNFSPSMMFEKIINNSFTYYKASNGILHINSIDTSAHGVINKLDATFSFNTDTTGTQFYSVSEGVINLK